MKIDNISTQASLEIVKAINTAKSRVGLDSPFIISMFGIDFFGQFTVHNEREYITLQNSITKEIYHDLRFASGNIICLIEWINQEAFNVNVLGVN